MMASVTALLIAFLGTLGSSSVASAQNAQWQGPARAEIKAFVKKQKGDVDQPVAFYGDFNGDNQEDAVVFLYKDIEGAAGNFDLKVALFRGEAGKYRFVRYASDVFGIEPREAKFSNGSVEITTTVPRADDPRCCPTGSKRYAIDVRLEANNAQTGQPAYVGRWAYRAGWCRNQPGTTDEIPILFTRHTLEEMESTCRFDRVSGTPGKWKIAVTCQVEGITKRGQIEIAVNGNTMNLKRNGDTVKLTRCPPSAGRPAR
jgi:hypothetical protein